MTIDERKITIAELCENYRDDGDGGVFGYAGRLCIRPCFQREFVYDDKKRDAVINTVRKGYPLGPMYWSKTGDDTYEILDGQQRTISIARYITGDFSFNYQYFHNLTKEEQDEISNYELTIFICDGTEREKLEWFKTINIAGAVLTDQELLNATYTGPWLSDAKTYFSKRNCVAVQMADGYIKGNPIRQDILEKVLTWIADRDRLDCVEAYMAVHQHDPDANELWIYYQTVINWARTLFPKKQKGMTDAQNWGFLYNRYSQKRFNSNTLDAELKSLILDDDVTKKAGIIPYLISDRTKSDERLLSIRAFTEAQKLRAYERQGHKCPFCLANGIDVEYPYESMQGDHIIPWSQGGHTTDDNLQMLCQKCNNDKSGR